MTICDSRFRSRRPGVSEHGRQGGPEYSIHEPSELLGRYILRRMEGEAPEALQALIMPELIERSDDRLA